MFSDTGVRLLYDQHNETLRELAQVEESLNNRFTGMEEPVRCLILAVASGEPMLFVGPPGTAKSRLIRAFCQIVGLVDDKEMQDITRGSTEEEATPHAQYFEYLLTPFTEPSELFGYFDLQALQLNKGLKRDDANMMQKASVVFLDEVFNASSAILNSLLTFMNERKFHDRGHTLHVPMQCLFSATNNVPNADELRAVFDRFLLRCWLVNEPADPARLSRLLNAGWRETHAPPVLAETGDKAKKAKRRFDDLLVRLCDLRGDIDELTREGDLNVNEEDEGFRALASLVENIRKAGLSQMSNRRLVKMAKVMLIHRLYNAAKTDTDAPNLGIEREDRLLLVRFGLDAPGDDFRRRIEQDPTGY